MKMVSNGYKTTMNLPVRPTSQFQARLEMTDHSVEDNAVEQSYKAEFSTSVFDKIHECDYLTFEQDFMQVGGNALIAPSGNYLRNGFVSSVLTDGMCNFNQIPTVELQLKETKSFVGMTYSFAKAYPTQIRVTAYLNGERVTQFISMPDGLEFKDEENHIPDCNRVTFEFLSMSEPYRRLRVSSMVFGLVKIFTNAEILSTTHDIFIDPISSSLPSNTLTMNVLNYDKDYDPDNPRGLWEYFRNGQPLLVRYGTTVDNAVEWVDSAYLYLSDAPTVHENTATFQASDAISYLTDTYYRGLYREEGISLYDLAEDVLIDAGVSAYVLPAQLREVKTYAPMPPMTHRECLQLIANAGRCVLYTNTNGIIVMALQINADVFISDNGHLPWANVDKTRTGGVAYDYITFEPNKWKIESDKTRYIVPDDVQECRETCFVSAEMSDSNARFTNTPKLYVQYSLPVSSYQFQISFDSVNEDYAPDFNVIFSNEQEVVKSVEVRGNTEIVYTVNEEVVGYTLVTIEILSTASPYHRIRVEAIDNGRVTDFYLDYQLALAKPTVTKTAMLKSVDVKVHSYTARDSVESLYDSGSIEIYGEHVIQASYSPSVGQTAEVTGGILVKAEFYSQTAFLTIQGNGSVVATVSGHLLNERESTVSVVENQSGEICPLDNPIISDVVTAQNVGEWVRNYLKNRNSYETNFRQDFRLDANDVIYFQSDFEEMIPVRITRLQYNLPGQTGAISVRRLT